MGSKDVPQKIQFESLLLRNATDTDFSRPVRSVGSQRLAAPDFIRDEAVN